MINTKTRSYGGFVHSPHCGRRLWEDSVDVGETSQTSTGGLLLITLCQGTRACGFITCNKVKAKWTSGAIVLGSIPTFERLDGKGSLEVDDFGVRSGKCRTIRLAREIDVPKTTKSAFHDHCVEYYLPFLTESEVEL